MADLAQTVRRLESQLTRGEVVLFLGAGFSADALDSTGTNLPTGSQLTRELWAVAFPDQKFDETTRLGDAYYAAKARNEGTLRRVLKTRLSVKAETLPTGYGAWFSMPWHRVYTLNLDDIELVAARQFRLPRPIRSISATSGRSEGSKDSRALEVIHLNGAIWDELDEMTFSDLDYASRLTTPSAAYAKCAVDILSRPVLVVGTEMNESPLWQYLEYRKARGQRGMRELRPGSYLVCPRISPAREYFLRELNLDWIAMETAEFGREVLQQLRSAADEGHEALREKQAGEERQSIPHLVSTLASESREHRGEYLLGHEPTWGDLQMGRAIERDCDGDIYATARGILEGSRPAAPLVLGGTAGSGKSTSLMRLGLRLTGDGIPVYWIDESSNIDPYRLRPLILQSKGGIAILVDDADLWGRTLTAWAQELPSLRPGVLFACGLRTTKVEGLLDTETLGGTARHEVSMPPLTDGDIEHLIAVLDRNNRLGILKGKSYAQRVEAFRQESGAGRQLLVAMIQATSGMKLKEKVFEEFKELPESQRLLYGIVCFVYSQRYTLQRDELLLASGAADNETLNAVEALVQRHLVIREDVQSGYRARHRVVAEELAEAAEFRPFAFAVLDGVCFAFANRVSPAMPRTSRPWRRLIRFMNHAYLLRVTTPENGREIYTRLEGSLHWDYHYWLQRGSLEVEAGDLERATHYLDQARSLRPDNRMVETEYGYLMMKKAARNPAAPNAAQLFQAGFDLLEGLIDQGSKDSPYPYHVIGSQGLGWARRGGMRLIEKRVLLQKLWDMVKAGRAQFPLSRDLKLLEEDLKRELLSTALPPE